MDEQFHLTLTNRLKLILLLIGALLGLMAGIVATGQMKSYLALSKGEGLAVFIIMLAGALYGFYRLIKTLSAEQVLISIASDNLTIVYIRSGVAKQLPFAAIAAYRHSSFNSDDILRLTKRDGTRMNLIVSGMFHGGQDAQFAAMVGQLEEALNKYHVLHEQAEVLREKTFFEKPISTILLFVYAAAMAAICWQVFINHKPVNGSFFTSGGFFVAYLVAWYAGRSRRQDS